MIKPKSPCSRDCPRRTATCHTYCQDYKDFESLQSVYREERLRIKNLERQFLEQRGKMYEKRMKTKHL